MIITYRDYILETEEERYNLSLKIKVTDKVTEELKDGFKRLGYGFTLESALNKISALESAKMSETATLKEYVKEYKKQAALIVEALGTEINNIEEYSFGIKKSLCTYPDGCNSKQGDLCIDNDIECIYHKTSE